MLKALEESLPCGIPDALTPERVEGWIDQINRLRRTCFTLRIRNYQTKEVQECAQSLAHLLPPTNEPELYIHRCERTDECQRFACTYDRLTQNIIARLRAINEWLYNPADDALESVYLHTLRWAVDKEPLRTLRRELKKFRADYHAKPDYQRRLEQGIEKLGSSIEQQWYGPEWIYFFTPADEEGAVVTNRVEVGRLLYRQRERFERNEKQLILFLTQLTQWSFLQNELAKLQKGEPAATEPAPTTSDLDRRIKFKGLSNRLLSNSQALSKLTMLLKAIDPMMNTSKGHHDQRQRWSHLYKAWMEAGFVQRNITDTEFSHLIHALLPSRSSKSVYNTLYRDKEKMDSIEFQAIVEQIKAHFQPVADMIHSAGH